MEYSEENVPIEQTEMVETSIPIEILPIPTAKDMVFNYDIERFLLSTSGWGKFLAILGFVNVGFMTLIAIIMLSLGTAYVEFVGSERFFQVIILLTSAVVSFFPANYLYKASQKLRDGILDSDNEEFTDGFKYLKMLFKYVGIWMIVVMSFYALLFMYWMGLVFTL